MSKVWKILALLLVITALVWLTTMWRWQSAQVDPSATDLVLKLGVLPVVLTAALVMTVWAVTRLRTYAVAPAASVAVATAPSQAATVNTAASERSAHVRVLASAVQLRAGSNWSTAQSGIANGECKPELDAQIKDDDGVAVFTAPLPDLATDAVADAMAELVATLARARPDAWVGFETPPEVLRALTLMSLAAGSMQEAIEAQWPALAALPLRIETKPPHRLCRPACRSAWPSRRAGQRSRSKRRAPGWSSCSTPSSKPG